MSAPIRLTICACSDCWKSVTRHLRWAVVEGNKRRTGAAIPVSTALIPGSWETDLDIVSCDVCGLAIPEEDLP